VIDDADMHASRMQIDAAVEFVLLCKTSSWPPWKMDAAEPASSAAAPRCRAASPRGIANLNGNAASTGSGGHDEYPIAARDGGRITVLECSQSLSAAAAG
jgi:hypothetical protein